MATLEPNEVGGGQGPAQSRGGGRQVLRLRRPADAAERRTLQQREGACRAGVCGRPQRHQPGGRRRPRRAGLPAVPVVVPWLQQGGGRTSTPINRRKPRPCSRLPAFRRESRSRSSCRAAILRSPKPPSSSSSRRQAAGFTVKLQQVDPADLLDRTSTSRARATPSSPSSSRTGPTWPTTSRTSSCRSAFSPSISGPPIPSSPPTSSRPSST